LLPDRPADRWEAVYAIQRWLFALVPIGFFGALLLFISLPWNWQWRIAFPAIVSALYAIPLFKWKRLRDFGSAKVLWLSVGWVWLCTVVPMSALGEMNWWFVLERLFFLIGLTLAFDWRDTEQDEMEGVITWALRFGRIPSLLLSIFFVGISIWFLFLSSPFGYFGIASHAWNGLVLSSLVTLLFLFFAYAKTRPHHLYYGFCLDGLLVLPGVLTLYLETW